MIKSEKYIGKVFEMRNDIKATIIDYRGAKKIDIKLSNGVIVENVQMNDLLLKNIGNPLEKSICGIGYLGIFETEIEAFKCYKKHKEESIKEIALLYYSNGLITTECYEALNKWTIDIND